MAMGPGSAYAAAYTTFSGCDIKAVFGNVTIGEIQAISVQVTREKAGIYTMGSPNPRSFSRGKRGIAGSLIFIQFDRDAVLYSLRELKFQGRKEEIRSSRAIEHTDHSTSLDFGLTSGVPGIGPSAPTGGQPGGVQATMPLEDDITSDREVLTPFYADQVPPFDVTLAAGNEYGDLAVMGVFGCEFLNEGWGISIDDLVSERQYTYLARNVSWWRWIKNPNAEALMGGR